MSFQKAVSNIVLIGMPGAGKSTIGVVLAKKLGMGFVDSDILIQQREKRSLQDIVDAEGYLSLRDIEEEVLLAVRYSHYVIATGGSAVYSARAMANLRQDGLAVYLRLDFAALEQRVRDFHVRGIARRPDQSFFDLFRERTVLYQGYADIVVNCDGRGVEAICDEIGRQAGPRLSPGSAGP